MVKTVRSLWTYNAKLRHSMRYRLRTVQCPPDVADQIGGFKHYSELSRSPVWRKDYRDINLFRYKMYLMFFLYKFLFHPLKFFLNIKAVISRNFNSKMEMAIYKYFKLRWMYFFSK